MKKKKSKIAPLPDGLASEFINQVKSYQPWCQVQLRDQDLLDLDSFAKGSKLYQQYRESVTKGSGQVVQGWRLLRLAGPSYLPIRTEFDRDPTSILYEKLSLDADSELLACGIELVLLPATAWKEDATAQIRALTMQELGHTQSSRQALKTPSTKARGAGGGGAMLAGVAESLTGGGSGRGVSAAATGRLAQQTAQARRTAIEEKLAAGSAAFSVGIYVWAEGAERSVVRKLDQLAGAITERYRAGGGGGQGNTFRVVTQGQGNLDEVRRRGYAPFFGSEPGVLAAPEVAALWHLPSPQEITATGLNWAKAVSPPPESDIVHAIVGKDGTLRRLDNKWRSVVCHYLMPDGSKQLIGLTEQALLRGQTRIGKPGSGKTETIRGSVKQAIERDDCANVGKGGSPLKSNGVFVSDPNRDLSFDLLDIVPDWYEEHVCFIDFTDRERVCSLNPMYLGGIKGINPEAVADLRQTMGGHFAKEGDRQTFLSILAQEQEQLGMNGSSFGGTASEGEEEEEGDEAAAAAVTSAVLEAICSTLGVSMDTTPNIYRFFSNGLNLAAETDKSANFWTLKRIMEDGPYREALVSKSRNELARPYWENDFPAQAEKQGGAALASTKNRLEALLRDPIVRRNFAQRKRTVKLRELLDQGKLVIACYSPELGANKPFIMQVSFKMLQLDLFSRADTPKEQRRVAELHLDEFQESVGTDPATVVRCFEQVRKYGGALDCCHQNLNQVSTIVKDITSNVGTMIAMNIGKYERDFYSGYFESSQWPRQQIQQAFAELPPFSMVPRIWDNGREHSSFVAQNLPPEKRLPNNTKPLLIALNDSHAPGGTGYRLDWYDGEGEDTNSASGSSSSSGTYSGSLLKLSKQEGYEGFWVATEEGKRRGVRPTLPTDCPGLIEALTRFLYALPVEDGGLRWHVLAFDEWEAAKLGLTPQKVAAINADGRELERCWQMLLEIEAMPPRQRHDYLASAQLGDYEWQLYRASRYGRDEVLREYILENPGLVPVKRERLVMLSRLKYGVPVPEIEAESKRPDLFTALADTIRERQQEEMEAEMLEEMLNPKKKGGGRAGSKSK